LTFQIVDEETRRRHLRQIRTHTDAVSALIDDLFELSRMEAGDITWTIQRVPLDELVGETVDAMRVQAAAKQVHVSADVPDGAHPEKLEEPRPAGGRRPRAARRDASAPCTSTKGAFTHSSPCIGTRSTSARCSRGLT
jgi:signal transduction histidine kinase